MFRWFFSYHRFHEYFIQWPWLACAKVIRWTCGDRAVPVSLPNGTKSHWGKCVICSEGCNFFNDKTRLHAWFSFSVRLINFKISGAYRDQKMDTLCSRYLKTIDCLAMCWRQIMHETMSCHWEKTLAVTYVPKCDNVAIPYPNPPNIAPLCAVMCEIYMGILVNTIRFS